MNDESSGFCTEAYNPEKYRQLAERIMAMAGFSVEAFEGAKKENGICYWYAHEYMASLGYATWGSFQSVITRAMGACTRLGMDPTEGFISDTYIEDGKSVKTYRLTRFACFLIAMHADSNKPEVAAAKAILAGIADKIISERDFGRLETRDDLKLAEKVMTGVAKQAGLEDTQFGIFKNSGFIGMYNMGIKDLGKFKGIGSGDTLYDFMGLEELAGNLFRVTQTAARIKNNNVRGLNTLSKTAKQVGQEVRSMMLKSGGGAPEQLPIEDKISAVKSKLKNANKQMKKLDVKKAGK
jgi:DNA-damage-inducible protein D